MKKALLITPMSKNIIHYDSYDYIGVDSGALLLMEENIPMCFAVGDFDSMTEDEFQRLQGTCQIIQHPVQKNETDSELAISLCEKKGYDEIVLYGALSGRIDHTLANIRLLMYRYPRLVLLDEHQKITVLSKGEHVIKKTYTHVSFFALEDTIITLEGFAYPLYKESITVKDIFCVSNSIVHEQAKVTLDKGKVLCVQSNVK